MKHLANIQGYVFKVEDTEKMKRVTVLSNNMLFTVYIEKNVKIKEKKLVDLIGDLRVTYNKEKMREYTAIFVNKNKPGHHIKHLKSKHGDPLTPVESSKEGRA
ncbi:MAG: hypothetical protein HRT90_06300 [Candidatus Margulisbacteria bacterium]|nr:hypothetical protein [Candidatus Margulisiibacteriota bacterium]